MIRQPLLALTLALVALPALAIDTMPLNSRMQATGAGEEAADQQVAEIIRISGLTGLSEQARNIAQQVLNDQAAPVGQQYDVVDRLAKRWSPQALQQGFSQILNNFAAADRAQLQSVLASRQLVNLRQKEQEAISHQSTAAYVSYVQRLRTQPPAPARLALIKELDQAMQFSALMNLTRAQVYPQLQAVLSGWQPPASWQTDLNRQVQEFLLYVHRTTPNDELQRLIQTYRQPVVQAWLGGVKRQLSAG